MNLAGPAIILIDLCITGKAIVGGDRIAAQVIGVERIEVGKVAQN
jgi:hypothetical protein